MVGEPSEPSFSVAELAVVTAALVTSGAPSFLNFSTMAKFRFRRTEVVVAVCRLLTDVGRPRPLDGKLPSSRRRQRCRLPIYVTSSRRFGGLWHGEASRRRVELALDGYVAERATDALLASPRPYRARRTMEQSNGGRGMVWGTLFDIVWRRLM